MPRRARFAIIAGGFLLWLGQRAGAGEAEPVRLLFPEQPPFTYTDESGRIRGARIKVVDAWFRRAGFEPRFESVPSARILGELRANQHAFCSMSWYWTTERATFALYSPSYTQDHRVLVVLKSRADEFRRFHEFREVAVYGKFHTRKPAYLSSGSDVDRLLNTNLPGGAQRIENPGQLWEWLAGGQIDYAVRSVGELQFLQARNVAHTADLIALNFPDLDRPVPEYVLCSRQFGEERMTRVRAAAPPAVPLP